MRLKRRSKKPFTKSFNGRKTFNHPPSPLGGGRQARAFLEKLKPLLETQVKREDAVKRLEELALEAHEKARAHTLRIRRQLYLL